MNKLKQFYYKLFPPNDWKLIRTYDSKCLVNIRDEGHILYVEERIRHYYIHYSKFRNEYKLTYDGFKATDDEMYTNLLNQIAELNKQINEK